MGNGQATSDQMTLTGIEPADVGEVLIRHWIQRRTGLLPV